MPELSPDQFPYLETTDREYAALAADTFTAAEKADGVVLSGPCPRCGAALEIVLFDETVRDWLPRLRRRARAQERSLGEPMVCNCTHDHPNRPPARTGCGAYWILHLVRVPDGDQG